MSEDCHSEDVRSNDEVAVSNIETEDRFDVMPHSSRVVIDGFLGLILVSAAFFFFFTNWSSMGWWSIVCGVVFLVGAVFVIRFPFTMK